MTDAGELIERAALADLYDAAPLAAVAGLRLASFEARGAWVGLAGALPASAIVVNRVIGIGVREPARQSDVEMIARAYAQKGIARYFVHRHPEAGPANLDDWFVLQGWEKARGWMKFERGTDTPAPDATTDLAIREIGPEHGEDFARIACDAFDLGEKSVPWLAALPGRKRWRIFMTFDGDEPAGTGALFVQRGIAWTDWGATAPEFRRRGGQRALLARRVAAAIDMGCTQIFTCTGEEVPGDPQHSYANILRCGFRETYVRANWAPPRPRS
ncbi:MAG: hypothetical protein VX871_08200 [Pseudomonadota bacterium]|nr:hypothetical protein [Pseudomonadota bacterium]